MTNNKFWNVKTDGKQSQIDLFGYVGGSKEWNWGFNEEDFLKEFRAIPKDNALNISINSFGGSVYTALSIYSLLKTHEGEITFRIDGAAMSAATIITSVPNAKVIMPKGSMMMIHKVSSIVEGNADDFRKVADEIEQLENNIIDIYVEKTGKKAEEIKPLVDEETYFTASQAVEFGLADEMDDTTAVENKQNGDVYMLNNLEVDKKYFAKMPKDFLGSADTQNNAPAGFNSPEPTNKEEKNMDLETLKAEHPEIVEAIRNEALKEGADKERARIQAIEELGCTGHDDLVRKAKFEDLTDEKTLAVQILKAENAKKEEMLKNRKDDAGEVNNVPAASNDGIPPKANNNKPLSREEEIAAERAKFKDAKNA